MTEQDASLRDISRHAIRKQQAREQLPSSPLRGFGTFGMIGWSVAVPTVAGAFVGLWLDAASPRGFSWTLALILAGVTAGVIIAWTWIDKEDKP